MVDLARKEWQSIDLSTIPESSPLESGISAVAGFDGDNVLEFSDILSPRLTDIYPNALKPSEFFASARKNIIASLLARHVPKLKLLWPNIPVTDLVAVIESYSLGVKNYDKMIEDLVAAMMNQTTESGGAYYSDKAMPLFAAVWMNLYSANEIYSQWIEDGNKPVSLYIPEETELANDFGIFLTSALNRVSEKQVTIGFLDRSNPVYTNIFGRFMRNSDMLLIYPEILNDLTTSSSETDHLYLMMIIVHEMYHAENYYSGRENTLANEESEAEFVGYKLAVMRDGYDVPIEKINRGNRSDVERILRRRYIHTLNTNDPLQILYSYRLTDGKDIMGLYDDVLETAKEELQTGELNTEHREQYPVIYSKARIWGTIETAVFPVVMNNKDYFLSQFPNDMTELPPLDPRLFEDLHVSANLDNAILALVVMLCAAYYRLGSYAAQDFFKKEFLPIVNNIILPTFLDFPIEE